uniref:Retinal rod rhodopsin-sensitive cGMP 3',5'-cyclic phosphodiesterase subunit gamma n=1 Tax=Camelus bactrianus TaxID=9837 RepID=A0A9W3EJL0_CAMBA|nr:retinal rod rhodopsin-sensitive cGMP 3',5'-cyclic phosphodiesterase subunit gamma isoform X1 [Camelus bactrianus]
MSLACPGRVPGSSFLQALDLTRAPPPVSGSPLWGCPPHSLISVVSGHSPNQLTQQQDKCPAGSLPREACHTPVAPETCLSTWFGDDIPGMEGLGTDITVICPWEAFNHLELHELAQYGII